MVLCHSGCDPVGAERDHEERQDLALDVGEFGVEAADFLGFVAEHGTGGVAEQPQDLLGGGAACSALFPGTAVVR
jgi:hypothetical protein